MSSYLLTRQIYISRSWRIHLYHPPIRHGFSAGHRTFLSIKHPKGVRSTWMLNWQKPNTLRPFYASLFVGAGLLYIFATTKTLRLESIDKNHVSTEFVERRYLPSNQPFTVEQVNAALRWDEHSQMCGMGSGILRFDTVQIPSNLPCEDFMTSIAGHEKGEIAWAAWGVFDGHA